MGLSDGCLILRYSEVYTVESLSLCYLPFVFIDLYVQGDDATMSYGSFMRTKYLCVLIHIRKEGDVCTVKHV